MQAQDKAKWAAAQGSLQFVKDGMLIGLGTGSTAEKFVRLLASKAAEEHWKISCVSTSKAIAVLAKELGLHRAEANGTGDGTNAVDLSTLFNMNQENTVVDFIAKQFTGTQTTGTDRRSMGTISLESYYNQRMTALGSDAETMDSKVKAQDEVLIQVDEWRKSVSAVNWNEELTNMIMFQQGYSACSRCLTTMDEMLDKLINSTGTVGR